jgi:kynurenine 3-monooxygenase
MAQVRQQRDGVAVVGGGLVGSLLSVFLARRGIEVTLYERRFDPRRAGAGGGRSINLVVTSRGIEALRRLGLERDVLALSVPVRGRMMHSVEGRLTFQPYGKDDTECNHSISRARLNEFLLSAAERACACASTCGSSTPSRARAA